MSSQGPTVLYEGSKPVAADIIFVHGLRGDAFKTWSHDKICWPRDILGKDIPNTRIITWGYDSNIVKLSEFSSQNSIFSHAENLLSDVARRRRSAAERERPIIFVGHSLGGLVIKESLIRSSEYYNNNQDMNLGAIYRRTVGVVFLGTPHRGSDKVALGQVVNNIAAFALKQPNDKILRNLEKESDVLERQRRSFASISQSMTLVCLVEEKPMAIGLIVPEHSASIDGFNVKTAFIPKNHSEMCKYANDIDIGYQRTSYQIMTMVDKIVEDQEASKSSTGAGDRSIVSGSASIDHSTAGSSMPMSSRQREYASSLRIAPAVQNFDGRAESMSYEVEEA